MAEYARAAVAAAQRPASDADIAEHMRLVDELWQAVEDFNMNSGESHGQDCALLQTIRTAREAVEASARRLAQQPNRKD